MDEGNNYEHKNDVRKMNIGYAKFLNLGTKQGTQKCCNTGQYLIYTTHKTHLKRNKTSLFTAHKGIFRYGSNYKAMPIFP